MCPNQAINPHFSAFRFLRTLYLLPASVLSQLHMSNGKTAPVKVTLIIDISVFNAFLICLISSTFLQVLIIHTDIVYRTSNNQCNFLVGYAYYI